MLSLESLGLTFHLNSELFQVGFNKQKDYISLWQTQHKAVHTQITYVLSIKSIEKSLILVLASHSAVFSILLLFLMKFVFPIS